MFRTTDWDLVSPLSWATDILDEEDFFSGGLLNPLDPFAGASSSSLPTTTTMYILMPEASRRSGRGRGRRQQQQQLQEQQPPQQQPERLQQAAATTTMKEPPQQPEPMQVDIPTDEEEALLDQDFFVDLPLGARQFETQMPANLATPPATKTKDGYAYNTYSYSCCATLDDQGAPVESVRRRYEDSAGVLKAVHRRQMGDQVVESSWLKKSDKDQGKHDKTVKAGSGDVETFETQWKTTPFGIAEKHAKEHGGKKQTELPDAPPPHEIP